ncbi:glycoside hydrolase superfamily, partial [Blastocladiella britannica]
LRAATVFGAMRGLDTLSQLLRPVDATAHLASAAPLLIRDAPRVPHRVPHRGLLLDTSRHYFPEETIRSVVDGIAAAKLNVLHWHMVDAQSFPFSTQETRDLAAGGAYSPHHVYDEAAIARIVAYARARGVRVVPEFDLPGHTFSSLDLIKKIGEETVVCADMHPYQPYGASPPTGQLHPTSSADVVKRVVAAAVRVFPDAYLHLGHDEINGKCWQAFNGGDTARTLVQFHDAVLRPALASAAPLDGRKEKKKKIMIWEEPIVEYDLDRANATRGLFDVVQLWRTGAPEVVRRVQAAGMQVVISDANSWYLDCGFGGWLTDGSPEDLGWCKMRPWQAIYAADPFTPLNLPPPVTSLASATLDISPTAVLGGEVAMWAEMTDQENVASKVFPRALAFAERAWSPSDSTSSISAHTVRRLSDARIRLLVVRGVAAGPVQPAWCAGREDHCAFI